MTHPTVAVGAVVVNDGALLMVQRGKDPGKGLWSIPGGRVETGELLADALKREVLEETGISIEVGQLAGILEVPGAELHYVILDYFTTPVGDTEPTAAGDAADARWVPLDDVVALDCTPRFIETMKAWGVL
jgi:ADP-ribose pyrophosphatase YjhB (NUDIX family)